MGPKTDQQPVADQQQTSFWPNLTSLVTHSFTVSTDAWRLPDETTVSPPQILPDDPGVTPGDPSNERRIGRIGPVRSLVLRVFAAATVEVEVSLSMFLRRRFGFKGRWYSSSRETTHSPLLGSKYDLEEARLFSRMIG